MPGVDEWEGSRAFISPRRRYVRRTAGGDGPDDKAFYKLPADEKAPSANNLDEVKLKSCGRGCGGDLLWDTFLEEWYCAQCGWLEWESTLRSM